eukprot:TRINITY_DN55690_c0_g1_i1.p1 TRINITY_DN55690_c0_g1~~TRINITY_DN55690_c0_g1_i1.p1  ORF type:complete len:361 (-),score=45.56 TRINITY_DN55690_c0_g1_i1:110-1192(-)
MGACQDKEFYVVCSWDNDEIHHEKQRPSRIREVSVTQKIDAGRVSTAAAAKGSSHTFTSIKSTTPSIDVDPRDGHEIPATASAEVRCRPADQILTRKPLASGNTPKRKVGFSLESFEEAQGGDEAHLSPLHSPAGGVRLERKSSLTFAAMQSHAFEPRKKMTLGDLTQEDSSDRSTDEIAALVLNEPLHLCAGALQWATKCEASRLEEVRIVCDGALRLRLCIRLTSGSLSFQVVSAIRKMKWRLHPRHDGANRQCKGASAGSFQLVPGSPDAIGVALGDERVGTSLTFCIVESVGTVVTVWVEVPVSVASNGTLDLSASPEASALGFRVWYTTEDTGVRLEIGDGVDVSPHLVRPRLRT